ncbi:MAG: hypothetical protein GY822_07285 [Deltaproteobacteria bacterium]|nr:hypothetical protein [Deltaproteobacteria bacterium]
MKLDPTEKKWLHVDAAYGGFFLLTERGRKRLSGIERADSVTLDPHKGLFLPYGTGALLVREQKHLEHAHAMTGDYLSELQSEPSQVDFCQISPELSRDFRGLRVWLPLKMLGAQAFRTQLDEKIDLTLWFTDELRTLEKVEIVAEPELSVVAFRYRDTDEENLRWLDAINAQGRVMLSGTKLNGRFVLRVCVLCFRTHKDPMLMAVEDLRRTLKEL